MGCENTIMQPKGIFGHTPGSRWFNGGEYHEICETIWDHPAV
jgi:hypothetical protein